MATDGTEWSDRYAQVMLPDEDLEASGRGNEEALYAPDFQLHKDFDIFKREHVFVAVYRCQRCDAEVVVDNRVRESDVAYGTKSLQQAAEELGVTIQTTPLCERCSGGTDDTA